MLKLNISVCIIVFFSVFTISCDDKNDAPAPEIEGDSQYIIVATPEGSVGEGADYILQTNALDKGTITTIGAGIEQDGYRYCIFHENKVFSLLYGQGNPGAVTTYSLNSNGILSLFSELQTETVQVWGAVNNELLLIKSPRSGDVNAGLYRINAVSPQIIDTKYVDVVALANNGERAHFTGAFQVDNKVYVPYMSIKGVTDQVFHSDYSDSTWVAVFSYPELELEKVIKDNRTGYIGYYASQSGLNQIENGDVYAFSTATLGDIGVVASTKPSAAVRIKKGTTEFDQDYFFNIQEQSGGYHLERSFYLGGTKFLLTMHADKNETPLYGSHFVKFAIVDVVAQSFSWVAGMPEPDKLKHVSRLPYVAEDGKSIYFGITTTDERPHIYIIDTATATAVKGLEVISGSITSIGKLDIK